MKRLIIIGSGIAGLSCALHSAQLGNQVLLCSPMPSERAQSVMAAGGINAAADTKGEGDSVALHIADTLKGGCYIADPAAVEGLCTAAPEILKQLSALGVVFTRDKEGRPDLRAFGGQSCRRTAYAGASTGKQIVSALTRRVRELEAAGTVERRLGVHFLEALVQENTVYGALLFEERTGRVYAEYGDALVLATGGQNRLFGKTTGSTLCDGSAVGQVFLQGAQLKNLEFIQYHPTTLETAHKRVLISEAARGEGGRLFYEKQGKPSYFMEEKYGPKGNLMPRDVVAREIYAAPSQVYLDIRFLPKEVLENKLEEVLLVSRHYGGVDPAAQPIPVYPSVHFFMGGLAVDARHRTSLSRLYAVGECASQYHGANRLGGNSLLAAMYSGQAAAADANTLEPALGRLDAGERVRAVQETMDAIRGSASIFPITTLQNEVSALMNDALGICRTGEKLRQGLTDIQFYRKTAEKLRFNARISPYQCYSLPAQLALGEAVFHSALGREESRGAHMRADFPETKDEFQCASYVAYANNAFRLTFQKEGAQ